MAQKLYILSGVLSVLILVNVFFIFNFPESPAVSKLAQVQLGQVLDNQAAYVLPISEPGYLPVLNTAIERPELSAKSAIISDLKASRLLYSKNIDARLPIASLTKLLSAIIVFEHFNLDDIVKIPKESVKVDGEKQSLYLGEDISVRNLLKMMLIESSNDAAYALQHYASSSGQDMVSLMNKKAIELGMDDSVFQNPAGLNDDALSTADDLLKLVKYSFKFSELWSILGEKSATVFSSDGIIRHELNSTNQLLGTVPDVIGGKTGYTDGALGCMILVVAVPGERDTLISIVLGSTERFTDTEKLIDWVRRAYSWE